MVKSCLRIVFAHLVWGVFANDHFEFPRWDRSAAENGPKPCLSLFRSTVWRRTTKDRKPTAAAYRTFLRSRHGVMRNKPSRLGPLDGVRTGNVTEADPTGDPSNSPGKSLDLFMDDDPKSAAVLQPIQAHAESTSVNDGSFEPETRCTHHAVVPTSGGTKMTAVHLIGSSTTRRNESGGNGMQQREELCDASIPPIHVTMSRPELKEGYRLVGSSDGDVYDCYPLSDSDIWRSRAAVPGDLERLRAVITRARAGRPVVVAALGGSVTHGGACASSELDSAQALEAAGVYPGLLRPGSGRLRVRGPTTHGIAFGPCSWVNRFVIWLRQHTNNTKVHKLFNVSLPRTQRLPGIFLNVAMHGCAGSAPCSF